MKGSLLGPLVLPLHMTAQCQGEWLLVSFTAMTSRKSRRWQNWWCDRKRHKRSWWQSSEDTGGTLWLSMLSTTAHTKAAQKRSKKVRYTCPRKCWTQKSRSWAWSTVGTTQTAWWRSCMEQLDFWPKYSASQFLGLNILKPGWGHPQEADPSSKEWRREKRWWGGWHGWSGQEENLIKKKIRTLNSKDLVWAKQPLILQSVLLWMVSRCLCVVVFPRVLMTPIFYITSTSSTIFSGKSEISAEVEVQF